MLEQVISEIEAGPIKISKRGRPKANAAVGWDGSDTLHLKSGVTLRKEVTRNGFAIQFSGKTLAPELIDEAMEYLRHAFDAPDS